MLAPDDQFFKEWAETDDGKTIISALSGAEFGDVYAWVSHIIPAPQIFRFVESHDSLSIQASLYLVVGNNSLGDWLYSATSDPEIEALGKSLQLALDNEWVKWDSQQEKYIVANDGNDITTLMWQVALTNWEVTKKELTASQVATMARISLQALGNAAFPPSAQDYNPDQVNKALDKARIVLDELSARVAEKNNRTLTSATDD